MSKRNLPHIHALEFRAADQAALLSEIATWFKAAEIRRHESPLFLLDVKCNLREEDIDTPEPYTATVYLDGPNDG